MTEETPEQTGPEQSEDDPGTTGSGAEEVPGSSTEQPQSQEELRARLEEQLRRLRVQDLLVESIVSVLNLTARRIAKEDERDLEQARVGIEAIRAWVDLLPEEAATQIRNALSEVQMLYAQVAEGSGGEQTGPEQGGQHRDTPAAGQSPADRSRSGSLEAEDVSRSGSEQAPRTQGEPPPRIWTPPGSN